MGVRSFIYSIKAAVADVIDNSTAKDGKVIDYGKKNTFPNDLLEVIDGSPTLLQALDKRSAFIQADGFKDKTFSGQKNKKGQTYDEVLADAADNHAYFEGRAYRILCENDGIRTASVEVIPFESVRKIKGGGFAYNPNFGTREYREKDNIIYPEYPVDKPELRRDIIAGQIAELGVQRGFIYYSFRNRPGKSTYPVPLYYAGIEDAKSEAGLLVMENTNIEQHFNVDMILYTVGKIDDETKDDKGKTAYDYFADTLKQFREPGERKILHIEGETKEGQPVAVPVPLDKILDGIDKARERVPKNCARHAGVPPAIAGLDYSEGLFGNAEALKNYMALFNHSILKDQAAISSDFKKFFPDINTEITTLNVFNFQTITQEGGGNVNP